jgi:hypothetical protein
MNVNRKINPQHLYTLNTHDLGDIQNYINSNTTQTELVNIFWAPNPLLINKLVDYLNTKNITTKIIDVGCSKIPFPKATHLLDFSDIESKPDKIIINMDLDFDKFEYDNNYFNFVYCRHTLEDIQNPQHAFSEIIRVSKAGYIETPSPLAELTRYIDASNMEYRGYIHHRYIIWSNLETNTLYFLPKYPIIEHITTNEKLKSRIILLNNYPVYWNNYYVWDISNKKPNIVVYRNGINMNIQKDYARLLNEALDSSIQYTNNFIELLKNNKL